MTNPEGSRTLTLNRRPRRLLGGDCVMRSVERDFLKRNRRRLASQVADMMEAGSDPLRPRFAVSLMSIASACSALGECGGVTSGVATLVVTRLRSDSARTFFFCFFLASPFNDAASSVLVTSRVDFVCVTSSSGVLSKLLDTDRRNIFFRFSRSITAALTSALEFVTSHASDVMVRESVATLGMDIRRR